MSFTNKTLEQLPPSEFSRQLQERVAQLNALLDLKLRAFKIAPKGSLRISQCHGNVQYYHRKTPDDKCGIYIDSKHYELAQGLAQKDYNKRLLASLKKEIKILQGALSQLEKLTELNETTETVLNSLTPLRRALIRPVTLSDSQYAAVWLSPKYKGKPFQPDSEKLYTSNGERVRSKSEVLIADALKRLGVPYRYEFPLGLKIGGRDHNDTSTRSKKITVHPDFLCLNLRTRQEFIWEHFGRMDDSDYSKKAAQKLRTYSENNIHPGKNLIITVEANGLPLSSIYIEEIIQTYLK
jgi:hypothetical protein